MMWPPSRRESRYSAPNSADERVATKFSTGGRSGSSLSVDPTICFTCPACRSMHGRKREYRLVAHCMSTGRAGGGARWRGERRDPVRMSFVV
eukprot:scaffold271936_cov26-Tisochrysis_lutea.AAC.1